MTLDRRAALRCLGLTVGAALVAGASACSTTSTDPRPSHPTSPAQGQSPPSPTPSPSPEASTAPAGPPTEDLPVAVHDAVIGALLPGTDAVASHAGLLEHDLVLYAARDGEPVAVLPGRNFLRGPTVVAAVTTTGDWTLVLTPARQMLPSAAGASGAPAQTAAWARTDELPAMQPATASVTVRVAEQSMTITTAQGSHRHEVGVGQDSTPTPTGVSGYLQARYVDPAQALAPGAIQLTSLHATAADEPYTGTDGGLIAIHANPDPRGRVSHGCIRVRPDAVAQLDALPLGTPIVVLP